MAIGAGLAGIPLSWLAVVMASDPSPGSYKEKLLIIWAVIAAIYVVVGFGCGGLPASG